jgi:hypothetical protein
MKKILSVLFPKTPKWMKLILVLPLLGMAAVLYAPMLLAFPHHAQFGQTDVYSVDPIHPRTAQIIARADGLVAQSPLYKGPFKRQIYLTDGGWRWRVLALNASGAAGLTRWINNAVILNRADVAADIIDLNRSVGGKRTLSGLVAHETAHLLQYKHFSLRKIMSSPQWMVEGYAEHVAQETSLTDADVRHLDATGDQSHPALPYYYGKKRVGEMLAKNGRSVDKLFNEADASAAAK